MRAASLRGSHHPRRAAPWVRRGGGGLLASALVHAAAAATLGGVLGAPALSVHVADDPVNVDVALVTNASANAPAPQARPAAREPSRSQHVASKRRGVTAPPEDEALPARFALSAGTVATRAAPATVTGARLDEGGPTAVGERDVDVPARLVSAGALVYPPLARQAEIELDLPLEIVVDAGGRVVSARGLRQAGHGLDEAAVRALRDYRFSPALRAGQAVAVRMRWTVQFRLR